MLTNNGRRLIRSSTPTARAQERGLVVTVGRWLSRSSLRLAVAFALIVATICLNAIFPELIIVNHDRFADEPRRSIERSIPMKLLQESHTLRSVDRRIDPKPTIPCEEPDLGEHAVFIPLAPGANGTRNLTLNSAFLQEIKDDNKRLRMLLATLSDLTRLPLVARSHREQVVEMIQELRDQLALHFTLEEAYGYFEDAVDVSPRIAERAAELRSQHSALFAVIQRLADSARLWETRFRYVHAKCGTAERSMARATQAFQQIVGRFRRFIDQLLRHESEENALILDALTTDIGGEG